MDPRKIKGNNHNRAAELHQRAEGISGSKLVNLPANLETISPEEILRILHELQVHQIELELQNEELRQAQTDLGIAKDRYFDFYNLAPVGYITLSDKGLILEVNLATSDLLGIALKDLVNQPITRFILPEDQDVFYFIRKKVFQTNGPQVCDLRMAKKDGTAFWVCLTFTAARDKSSSHGIMLTDITERKQSEQALLESEEYLSSIFRSAPVGIGLVVNRELKKVNSRLCMISGYDEGELIGQSARILYPSSEDFQFVGREKYAQIRDHGTGTVETYWQRKDGTIIDVLLSSTPVDLQDHSKGVTFTAFDISKSKRAEASLREGEEKFRTIASFIHNWEYWLDGGHNLVYISPSCKETTSYTEEEFYQDPGLLTRIIHPDDRESFNQHFDNTAQSTTNEDCQAQDFRILTRNGEERWIAHVCRNVFDQEGKHLGHRVSNREITKRKVAEAEQIESAQRLQLATASGKLGVWDWNVKNNIMFWDDRMLELYGISRDTFFSNIDDWTNSLHPDDKQRVIDENNAALLGEKEFDTAFRVLHPDGTIKHIKAAAIVTRDKTGKAIRMIGINSDITEQIQVEEERRILESHLQQAQKMEAIGTLAGGIAHDFNNILSAILGYADMAYEDSLSGSVKSIHLNHVIQAGHRAAGLVKQILAFSRQAETQKIPMRPVAMVKESVKLLRSSLPATIDIQQDIDPETNLILADPTQIHQIIMNLCTNAYHAMEETGGTLSISLKNKDLTQQDLVTAPDVQQGHCIQLSIRDTGSGIPSEIRKKIFDPYFTTKEAGKGTGMGLAIVHGIVKAYGGFITCDSEIGVGTVFKICLPSLMDQIIPEAEEFDLIPVGTERILFIDDEEILAMMSQNMLERLGYLVTVKMSSIEALTTFKNEPEAFDLVITDQTMHGMTGVDLAQRMLQIRPDLPIILCTGYSSQISRENIKSYGIKGFAMKPLARKDIAVLIRKVLD